MATRFAPPAHTEMAPDSLPKPPVKALPSQEVAPHMAGLRTDEELRGFLAASKGSTAVVEFGTSWCQKCHEIFPTFYRLSKQHDQLSYAVAQVENMRGIVSSIRFTPTFAFYRDGRKVDEVVGKEARRLADHLWLHSD